MTTYVQQELCPLRFALTKRAIAATEALLPTCCYTSRGVCKSAFFENKHTVMKIENCFSAKIRSFIRIHNWLLLEPSIEAPLEFCCLGSASVSRLLLHFSQKLTAFMNRWS